MTQRRLQLAEESVEDNVNATFLDRTAIRVAVLLGQRHPEPPLVPPQPPPSPDTPGPARTSEADTLPPVPPSHIATVAPINTIWIVNLSEQRLVSSN